MLRNSVMCVCVYVCMEKGAYVYQKVQTTHILRYIIRLPLSPRTSALISDALFWIENTYIHMNGQFIRKRTH